MAWILFVALAALFYALVSLVDKYVLTSVEVRPSVLVFYLVVLRFLRFPIFFWPWVRDSFFPWLSWCFSTC